MSGWYYCTWLNCFTYHWRSALMLLTKIWLEFDSPSSWRRYKPKAETPEWSSSLRRYFSSLRSRICWSSCSVRCPGPVTAAQAHLITPPPLFWNVCANTWYLVLPKDSSVSHGQRPPLWFHLSEKHCSSGFFFVFLRRRGCVFRCNLASQTVPLCSLKREGDFSWKSFQTSHTFSVFL